MSIEPQNVDYDAYSFYSYKKRKRNKNRNKNYNTQQQYKYYESDYESNYNNADEVDNQDIVTDIITFYKPVYEPEIIDMRDKDTINNNKVKNKKKVKGKRLKSREEKKNSLSTLIIILLLCVITTMMAITYKDYQRFIARPQWLSVQSEKVYYAVEMANFPDYDSAYVYSDALRKQGGGGFIIRDTAYRVLAAAYTDEEDANSVIKKLNSNGNNARVYPLIVPKYNLSGYNSSARELILNSLNYYSMAYSSLYSISNSLDLKQITEADALNQIELLKRNLSDIKNNLDSGLNASSMDTKVIKIKAELVAAIAIVDNLTNSRLARPNLLCDIRYSYIMLINNYINLINSM